MNPPPTMTTSVTVSQFVSDALDVRPGADGVHACEIGPRRRELSRRSAGGPDESAVLDRFAVSERHTMSRGVHGEHRAAADHLNPLRLPELRGPNEHALEWPVAAQEFLGQGRPLVRQLGFRTDQRDGAAELSLAQSDGSLRAAVAGADDDDVISLHRRHGGADGYRDGKQTRL